MGCRYCEVALAVLLRHTFTYAIPEALAEVVVPGSRVVVPFRNRALVGAVLGLTGRRTGLPRQPLGKVVKQPAGLLGENRLHR